MTTQPILSACMVLYHPGEETLRAIQCLKDTPLPIDFFAVDNTPEDGMAAQIKALLPSAHILPQAQNVGFGRGNNAALPHLTSRYHLLINPDVSFAPDLLPRMIAYMDEHPEATILTPRVFSEDGSEQYLPKKQPTLRYLLGGRLERLGEPFRTWRREYTLEGQDIRQPTPVGFATGCFLLIRTDVFRQLGGFDERFFLYQEDSDLSRRAMGIGPIIYHPDMRVTHAWARENTRTLRGNLRQISSIMKFFMKWGWRW